MTPPDPASIPFTPTNGRVLIWELPFKPSKILECISIDKADRTEGIVCKLSPCQLGRKYFRGGWEHNAWTYPHEVKVGDRVFFKGSYQDEDTMTFNGVRYRCMDSHEIVGILDAEQPEGFDHPTTGEKLPDFHPLLAQ